MIDRIGNRNHSRAAASGRDVTAMTTLSQNNSVAGSLVLNDYLNTSLQNTQVIGKETAVGRFEDPPAPDAGPLDHTLKPRSGNGGACSSLTQPRKVEEVVEVAAAGAFKTRCGRPCTRGAGVSSSVGRQLSPSATGDGLRLRDRTGGASTTVGGSQRPSASPPPAVLALP